MFYFIFEKKTFALPKAKKYLCRAMLKINPFALPKAKEKMSGLFVSSIANHVILSTTVLFFTFSGK